MFPLNPKCIKCNDQLTDGEAKVFFEIRSRQGRPPLCYQCSQKEAEDRQEKWDKEYKII